MKETYKKIIEETKKYGGILDVLLRLQEQEGYVTKEAVNAVAESYGMFPSQVYEAGSFYGMLQFQKPKGRIDVRVCRGAPCHVAGSRAVIEAVEKELEISIENATQDGTYYFGYTECQGQCQAAPTLLIDGKIHTDLTPEAAVALIREAGKERK